jgi:TnpA family transposase
MSTSFLTAAERDRWQRFPETIPHDDLAVYFLLSADDQRAINRQREPCNRLGYALQLCTLRYLGFVPTDFTATPEVVVTCVAEQLGMTPRVLVLYDNRRTQSEHRRHVRAYVGFRPATPMEVYALQTWLLARALEHDKPTLLLQLACEKLYRERIVRPGVTRLERFVATAREQAHEETFRQLIPLLTNEQKTFLDGLLQPDATTGRTLLSWLRHEAVSHAASHIATLTNRASDAGVDQWHLGPSIRIGKMVGIG